MKKMSKHESLRVLLNRLHNLENRRHNLNRKIRKLMNDHAYLWYGYGSERVNQMSWEKTKTTMEIQKIRSILMRRGY